MEHVMRDECGLAVDYGAWFGGTESRTFIRVNLATRRENIEQAAEAIVRVLKNGNYLHEKL
jgi:cystathionine beta-lyase